MLSKLLEECYYFHRGTCNTFGLIKEKFYEENFIKNMYVTDSSEF